MNYDNGSDYSETWNQVESPKQAPESLNRLPSTAPTTTISNVTEEKKCRPPVVQQLLKCARTNLLTILTVSGVVTGVLLGVILRASRPEDWTQREQIYMKFIGDLFLRMLQALILPLIVSSLIAAIGSLDLRLSKKIGARALTYYMFTTVSAVVLGIILVVVIHPGKVGEKLKAKEKPKDVVTTDALMDLVRNMFPPNLVQAALYQFQTTLQPPSPEEIANATAQNKTIPVSEYLIVFKNAEGMNIMGLVVFSVILGITLGIMGERGKPLMDFFICLSESMMIVTRWVVWLSPIGVCFLIAAELLAARNISSSLKKLGLYFITVFLGLCIHGFIVLPVIYGLVTRKLPFKFMGQMAQALITAFGTASSSATLPITIECLEDNAGVDPRVSRFVVPIGATVNMDGTALYEAVAAIFIAQIEDRPLGLGTILAIVITATAASIGAAGIPQAGLVTMVMVLNTVGLSAEYLSYVVPVDWLLDRLRTTVNVLGDSFGAALVNDLSKKDLEKLPIDTNTEPLDKQEEEAGISVKESLKTTAT